MFKLLNRLAYFLSFCMWFIISLLFISIDAYNLWTDDIIGAVFFWFIVWLIFKKLFLSKDYIESRLEFFANGLTKIEQKPLSCPEDTPSDKFSSSYQEKEATNNIEEFIKEEIDINNYKLEWEVFENDLPKIENNSTNINTVKEEIVEKVSEPSKLQLAIKNFFSENLLAKIWGILVFLWVLFLLSLVYSSIWPVWKLIIWFIIWFWVYFSWVILDKKNFHNEWRILLGIWILINYLVILSGRHLISYTDDTNILSIGITFVFLIFNTVFAVLTSLIYKSRTLLLFSFIFAFINPLLIWWSSDNPYTLVWYSLIVAFGWLFLSVKQRDILLAIWVFLLSNILFLIAPDSSDIHWIVKLASSAIISILSIYTVYKIDIKQLFWIFIWSYLFLVFLLWTWDNYLKETTSFISYMFTIVLYFAIGIYCYLKTSFNSLIFLLFSPIFIVLWLSFSRVLFSITKVLALIVLVYLVWFVFIKDKLPDFLKYIFFIVLWFYIFITNSYLSISAINLSFVNLLTVIIVSFIFIFTSYYLSTKKNLEFLYSIGTIWAIFTLAPVLVSNFDYETTELINTMPINLLQFYTSVIALIVFALSNWILPFLNPPIPNPFPPREKGNSSNDNLSIGWLLSANNIKNLLIWVISGLLFIGFEIYNYWTEFFPGVTLWIAYGILAIIYFFLAYFMMNMLWIENIKKQDFSKNVIYTYLWVTISIFSLAIALIFSEYEAVVSAVWLFEATIMFYFYNKTKEIKIFSAWIILFMIGVFKLFILIDVVKQRDFLFLIPFSLIFISYVLNIKFLDSIKSGVSRFAHDILHILWITTLWILLLEIIPSTWHGWSTLWIAVFLFIINFVYSYYSSRILKIFFILIFTWYLILQVWELDSIYWKLDNEKLSYLRILQYISTALVWMIVIFWNRVNKQKVLDIFINLIFSVYLLFVTSYYVYDIFDTTFAITIYWWVTSSVLLFYGIAKDLIKLRTIWLYLISLTAIKIFFYDIWYGIDDAVSRVVAFIFIWILMIIISTRYTKKYWNNIVWEFRLSNITNTKNLDLENNLELENISTKAHEDKVYLINEKIKNLDVSNLRGVKFYIYEWDNVEIRAENLMKIVKMITNDFQDIVFEKWELTDTYEFVINNYKSELSKATYDKIVKVLKQFSENWWKVEAIFKK